MFGIELLQRLLAGGDDCVDFVDAPLGHTGAIVGKSRHRLFKLRLLHSEDFLDLGGGESNGVVDTGHTRLPTVNLMLPNLLIRVIGVMTKA